ncbi:DUF5666 domain-containing protein [Ramlibacter sp.]|uniref:DUF5666 domain-containing protein n=1 Tax=Ramlibacter sp. TaxID=1917967 RepID=UPI002D35A354|nr:DUF5666 domain-containing protein [Ramlibacter sp.]HYD75357.1 DUF5666 domain-containing protein [Ramlibacter sp.]
MTRAGRSLFALLLAALLAIPGCGGGGSGTLPGVFMEGAGGGPGGPAGGTGGDGGIGVAGIGSGGTGIGSGGTGISGEGVGSGGTGAVADGGSIGSVDGFGSIIVNGTRFEIDSAQLLLEDAPSLRLGMTVRVTGTLSADLATGTASLVLSAAELRGRVADLDAAAGRFSVLSVPVATDPSTVYAGGLRSLADVRPGDAVQVHGMPGLGSQLRATRIELLATDAPPVLSGPVQALDTAQRTFSIGSQRVRYAAADFLGVWPATGLAEGQAVRVRARSAGDPLEATSVELLYPLPASAAGRFSLGGVITRASGLADLQVDGVPVDASAARISGGPAREVLPGARVEVAGTLRDGVLVATRLKLRHAPSAPAEAPFSASGPIGALRSPADFRVRGQQIDAGSADVLYVNGSAADLANGRQVQVSGSRVVDDVLLAEQIEFLP